MSEFIEPCLVALSQFLTEEERGKLPPPWSEKEEKKKGKRKRKKTTNPTTEEFQYGLQAKLTPEIILDKGDASDEKNDIDTACTYAFHQPFFPDCICTS